MFDKETKKDLDTLIALANKYRFAGSEVHQYLQAGGAIVEPAIFYTNIPMMSEIDDAFEYKEAAPFDLDDMFDTESVARVLEALSLHSKEFSPPEEGDMAKPAGYFWKNNMFSYSDAMSYYAMIRQMKPKTIVEIGSGFSTLVARAALDRNGSGRLICIEPFPRDWLKTMPGVELMVKKAQEMDADFFNQTLADGDILFIDSTHTVKTGSDCLHLYLRVLPRLTRDLAIHVHDVFLPQGMPVKWEREMHIHWTEQHLLHAYMIGNPRTRLIFGSAHAYAFMRPQIDAFMHGHYQAGGGSFWFRQVPPGNAAPRDVLAF